MNPNLKELVSWMGMVSQRVDAYEKLYPRLARRIERLEAQVRDLKMALASPAERKRLARKMFPRE